MKKAILVIVCATMAVMLHGCIGCNSKSTSQLTVQDTTSQVDNLECSITQIPDTTSQASLDCFPFWGEWDKLTITDPKDSIIFNPSDVFNARIIANKDKKELFIRYGIEDTEYDIVEVKIKNDIFIIIQS